MVFLLLFLKCTLLNFSFTDSYLPNNQKKSLQVSYTYDDLTNDLKNCKNWKTKKKENAYLKWWI